MSNNIIINSDDNITCPHCEAKFLVRDGIASNLIEQHEVDYQRLLEDSRNDLADQIRKQLERSLVKDKETQIAELTRQLEDSGEAAKKLELRIEFEKKKAAEQATEAFKLESDELQRSIATQKEQIDDFRRKEIQLRQEKSELEESRNNLDLELARRLDEEKQALRASLEDNFKLKEREFNKKLADVVNANEEMKRKLEQGSQQLQGEVLELELEALLSSEFPFDAVEAVKTGARGADIIQTVKTRSGNECGKIVWETKRTENWSNNWTGKLKADVQSVNGNLGVIVSSAFPADEKGIMALRDDVWIVKPQLAKSLAETLRIQLIEVHRQKVISAGRDEQVEAVYQYICSPQFFQRVKAIVDNQKAMRDDLEKERNAYVRIWNKREKQIDGISAQMMAMAGEIQGLASGGVPLLEQIAALDI